MGKFNADALCFALYAVFSACAVGTTNGSIMVRIIGGIMGVALGGVMGDTTGVVIRGPF